MKKFITCFLFSGLLFTAARGGVFQNTWQKFSGLNVPSRGTLAIAPSKYVVYTLNEASLKGVLLGLSEVPEEGQLIDFPTPDGSMRSFRVWQSSMMEPGLAVKYPQIRTFSGYAEANHGTAIKLDFTEFGFHAMVFEYGNTYFIDPYNDLNEGYYICYFKKDYFRPAGKVMTCEVNSDNEQELGRAEYLNGTGLPPIQLKVNGATRKNYRLALACTIEYADAVTTGTPTTSAVLSKMVTSMNRINGVYERELDVHMTLVANEDTLIFLSGTDPYSNSNGGSMLGQNQTVCNARIGAANYDIGHVFSTGGGGIASLGCVCNSNKAQGVTGSSNPVGDSYDIDYVAHEMGHQFGAEHTFNSNLGSCNGNRANPTAYEPGSGTTLMAYAGICDADNTQAHSDDYFHAISLSEITNFISGSGGTCATTVSSNNTPPVVSPFSQSYNIPFKTPFELTAPAATDADHDTLTYCWEQWNRGDYGATIYNTHLRGPIFRSFLPDTSRTRVFPTLPKLLAGVTVYVGEKLPDTTRYLTFKLTVRDVYNGFGTFNLPDDTIHLEVTQASGPFKVLSPASVVNWTGNTTQTITWDVANTTAAPVSCANVDIFLSTDGGYTYPYTLATATPNDGSESVTIPNVATTNMARIKVKGTGNVFFNVNTTSFTITHNTAGITDVPWKEAVKVYPVPATDMLNVINSYRKPLHVTVVSAVGQMVWNSEVDKYLNIPVSSWSKGVYYLQLTELTTGERLVKPVVIQ